MNNENQGTCPSCGYCPHCGRGGYGAYPQPPYYQPIWVVPQPWWPQWSGPIYQPVIGTTTATVNGSAVVFNS